MELMQRIMNDMHMKELTIAYGMTETSPKSCHSLPTTPLTNALPPWDWCSRTIEVKIVDTDTGDTLPIGQVGEVLTRAML